MATLDEVLSEATKNHRVCPQPLRWNELWELLPNRQRKVDGWEPAAPLILAAWYETAAISKARRLREHLEWAAEHGALEQVWAFLIALREEEWHHSGE